MTGPQRDIMNGCSQITEKQNDNIQRLKCSIVELNVQWYLHFWKEKVGLRAQSIMIISLFLARSRQRYCRARFNVNTFLGDHLVLRTSFGLQN